MKPVEWTDVEDEVAKADTHKTPIKKLIIATTAPNDASLLKKVQELSSSAIRLTSCSPSSWVMPTPPCTSAEVRATNDRYSRVAPWHAQGASLRRHRVERMPRHTRLARLQLLRVAARASPMMLPQGMIDLAISTSKE